MIALNQFILLGLSLCVQMKEIRIDAANIAQTRRKLQQIGGGGGCVDVIPPNATFDCSEYTTLGLCGSILTQYCQLSCGRCSCEDELVPGISDCETVVALQLCDTDEIQGKFCNLACGNCAVTVDCTSVDAIECDIEGLQALMPSYSGTDPCNDIPGVTCQPPTNRVNSISIGEVINIFKADGEVNVIGSNPNFIDLRGQTIPAELSKLRFLDTFEVEKTDLTGTIPPQISTLTNLQIFDIDGDTITGTLPQQLSTWTQIQWFDVSQQRITGSLPETYSTWSNIFVADFSETRLSGALPASWSTLSTLNYLYLYDTRRFTGKVPPQWSNLANTISQVSFGTQTQLCIDAFLQIRLLAVSNSLFLKTC